MRYTIPNSRRLITCIAAMCVAGATLTLLLSSTGANGQPAYVVPVADQPLADAGLAAFQRASTAADALPAHVQLEIEAAAPKGGLHATDLNFANSRRLTSEIASNSATVYLVPGMAATAPACIVQMVGTGYTYGCGPEPAMVDESTAHANLTSLGNGLWRYWGIAPRRARAIDLILDGGTKLVVPVDGDVFGIDTAERPRGLEWTDTSGAVHQGTLSLPPAPPT